MLTENYVYSRLTNAMNNCTRDCSNEKLSYHSALCQLKSC